MPHGASHYLLVLLVLQRKLLLAKRAAHDGVELNEIALVDQQLLEQLDERIEIAKQPVATMPSEPSVLTVHDSQQHHHVLLDVSAYFLVLGEYEEGAVIGGSLKSDIGPPPLLELVQRVHNLGLLLGSNHQLTHFSIQLSRFVLPQQSDCQGGVVWVALPQV